MKKFIFIVLIFGNTFVEAKNQFNISYSVGGRLLKPTYDPKDYNTYFRNWIDTPEAFYQVDYQICGNGCISLGLGYSNNYFVLEKYQEAQANYLAWKFDNSFRYATFRYGALFRENSDVGLILNIGQVSMSVNPYAGVTPESYSQQSLRTDLGAFIRFGFFNFSNLQRLFIEFSAILSFKQQDDIVINSEKIDAGYLKRRNLLINLGLGLSF